ncbi:MAG TPA: CehA/McbA family metallohydrolase, partial [Acidimicrobiales bacterium]|nr:CehA/McbA family metallohydrolase [Acidimicrobiales bacterium]
MGARLVPFRCSADDPVLVVEVDAEVLTLGPLATPAQSARLRLRSARPSRWSVTDTTGGAWFPDGSLEKWDFHHRPFFHAAETELDVPAGTELHVSATRGMEYRTARAQVTLGPGSVSVVNLEPERRLDPAGTGWYGGDLHVHMNYSGDLVCQPSQAALMQLGEGLHLMNLVAANATGTRVFDREALEEWAGHDLPWSSGSSVARMGVEYRNDLLGHVHALGPSRPPSVYHTGHRGSDHDEDWPPNSVACRQLRAGGAALGYCHPVMSPISADDISPFFQRPRSVEARELVVDAALGLVDSVDVLSNGAASATGSALLYRRLLGAGHRLAVTAGTDVFLSFSSSSTFSNPPGFARVYAQVEGDLTVESFKTAIRQCRTVVTNGPWLELEVEGHGPGARLDPGGKSQVRATARVDGPDVDSLALMTPDGKLAEVPVSGGTGVVSAQLPTGRPTWVVAVAIGASNPEVIDHHPYAHTSPVWVHREDERVLRTADVQWCLDWVRRLERLVRDHGTFHSTAHLDDVLAEIGQAARLYRDTLRVISASSGLT